MVVGQLDQVDDRGSHEPMEIANKIDNLEDQFNNLRTRIMNELSTKPDITVQVLLNQLTGLPLSLRREYESSIAKRIPSMRTETQVNDLFIIHLNPLTSFIDYGLIEYVIKKFGSDGLKRDMQSYCSEIMIFMKETTIKQLIDHLPGQAEVPPKFSLIEAKIGENASECTLEKLNTIRKRQCSELRLSEIVFHLLALLDSNSFVVRWLVPSALVSEIMKSIRNVDQSFYQEFKITFLTLDGMWLHMSESEIMWSQVHVSNIKFKDKFRTICKQIVCEMKMRNVSEDDLSLYFQTLHCQPQISDQLSLAVLNYELPASFVDFRVLKAVIDRFGSDCLKRVMRSYCNYMSVFTKESTAQQLINIGNMTTIQSTDSKHFKIARCKIMEEPSHYKLERLLSFRTRFCTTTNYSEVYFTMDEVNTESNSSFTVSWLVSTSLISDTIKFSRNVDHNLYHQFQITSLTLDGMWLYMSESEIDVMWSQLYVSDTMFKDTFRTMCKQIVCEMKMQNVSEDDLSLYFQTLHCQPQISDQLSRAVLNYELPASFVDFKVLKAVIDRFGSDCLKRVMRSYCNYISSIFTKKSTAQQLINLSALQSEYWKHFVAARCTIMEEPSHCRLEKLLQFRTRFCAIASFNEVCFILDEVNIEMSGSFTVSWLVPSALLSDIIVKFKCARYVDQSFYQEYKITSLTLDGMWLYMSDTEIVAMWSKMRVGDTEFNDQFHIMHKQALCEVDGIGRSTATDKLSSYLMDQQPTLQQDASVNISEAILSLNYPISVIDFRMLTIVIELFGGDCLKRVMESYCHFMSTSQL